MKIFISFLIMIFSIFMFFLNHPLSMGLMILIQTILICMISGMLIQTYWFSYILFLTFLGGLLVLFIYVSSIASNELFMFSNNIMFFIMICILNILIYSMINYHNLNWLNFFSNNEMNQFFNKFLWFNNEEKISLSKLYNNQTFMLMMMMITFLFITLLAVVKITNIYYGPIRSNKY